MKERIEDKLNEVVENILAKDISDISLEEFNMLASHREHIISDEERIARNKEMSELLVKSFELSR